MMKNTLIVIFVLIFGIGYADTSKNITSKIIIDDSNTFKIPPAINDTVYQKVFLDNDGTKSIWESNFWTSFFSFLISALSISIVVYQNKRMIPSEADKLILNERFRTHVELMKLIKDISRIKVNVQKNENVHDIFFQKERLKSIREQLIIFADINGATLSHDVKKHINILATLFLCALVYNLTDSELQKYGTVYFEQLQSAFYELEKKIADFFNNGIKNKYEYPLLTEHDMEFIYNKVDGYPMIKETVGDFNCSKLISKKN